MSQPVNAPVGDREKRSIPADGFHQVRRGETLYSIAWQYGLDVRQLAEWNRIAPPYTIYHQQRLRLQPPPPSTQRASRPKPVTKAVSVPKPPGRSRPVPARPVEPALKPSRPKSGTKPVAPRTVSKKPVAPAKTKKQEKSGPIRWRWPATGRLLSRFDPKLVGKKGISIVGRSGDPVRAAAPGKVVYAGSGLSGYGRLIIIKHNQVFLSAYAHNRKLIAKEGQWVEANQVIARMGDSGTNRTQLYFEIRKNGTPVDPLKYLPKR